MIRDFQRRWGEIGFVPIKQKDAVQKKYKAAVDALFNTLRGTERDRSMNRFREKVSSFQVCGRQPPAFGARTALRQGAPAGAGDRPAGEQHRFLRQVEDAEALIADVKAKIERAREDMAPRSRK